MVFAGERGSPGGPELLRVSMNLRVCLFEVDSSVLKQLTNKEAGASRYTLEASMDVYVKAAK